MNSWLTSGNSPSAGLWPFAGKKGRYARHQSAQREVIEVRTLPSTMIQALAPLAPLFSKRVWAHVQVLLAGTILAPGKRTVTSALGVVGLEEERQFCRYHRVLNRATWSGKEAARVLLGLLVEALVPDGPLVLGVDGPLLRCWDCSL